MSQTNIVKNIYHVTYDIITRHDEVIHKSETINAKSSRTALTHLRIKNKKLGAVRNFSYSVVA